MFAAERVTPCVTTAGMVTPIGPSGAIWSEKWSTICATTSATFSGVDFAGVSIRSRFGRELAGRQVDRRALDAAAADVDAQDRRGAGAVASLMLRTLARRVDRARADLSARWPSPSRTRSASTSAVETSQSRAAASGSTA